MYYPAVELAVGARRELSPDEIEQRKVTNAVEEAIERGDADWASLLNDSFGTPDFEQMLDMEGVMEDIESQLDNQMSKDMRTEYGN